MKRILVLLLTVSMIAAAFAGCAEKFGSSSADTNGNGLRDDVELKIMKDCYEDDMGKEFDSSDIIVKYYGTYNGAIAVKVSRKDLIYASVYVDETVGEFVFRHSTIKLRIYVNGKFISITQAYDTGVLTDSDLAELYSAYRGK